MPSQGASVRRNKARLDRPAILARAMKPTSPEARMCFMTIFAEYVYAVIDEASDHANRRVRGVEDYFELTRLTDGGHTSFLAAEAGSNIPDEVMAHPSFDPEIGCRVSRPHTRQVLVRHRASVRTRHNIVPVIINKKGVDLDGAQLALKVSQSGSLQFPSTISPASFLGSCGRCRRQRVCGEIGLLDLRNRLLVT